MLGTEGVRVLRLVLVLLLERVGVRGVGRGGLEEGYCSELEWLF